MPTGPSPQAVCSRTGVTIPECSCGGCLEEQIRRHSPDLLEPGRNSASITVHPARGRPRRDTPGRKAA